MEREEPTGQREMRKRLQRVVGERDDRTSVQGLAGDGVREVSECVEEAEDTSAPGLYTVHEKEEQEERNCDGIRVKYEGKQCDDRGTR